MSELYKYLILIIVIFLSIPAFLYFHFQNLFNVLVNSNLLMVAVTFLAGIVAMLLYFQQKNDFKMGTASIIFMEIRQAEEFMEKLKVSLTKKDVDASITLLPTNNWNKYKYLFIKDFDQDELALINRFYNECSKIDKAISQLNLSSQLEQKSNHIHQAIVNLAKEIACKPLVIDEPIPTINDLNKEFQEKEGKFLEIIRNDGFRFIPNVPLQEALVGLDSVERVTITSVGIKFKKIAKI